MTESEYKDLSRRDFSKAAKVYETDDGGIYKMCRKDYPDILEELEKEEFTDLLDCGCGPAPMLTLLHKKYPEKHYTGIDLTPEMIEVAKAKGMLDKARERLEDCGNITFIQGDVGQLPMDDESCDIVMSMNGFHAFPDKKKAFKETWRVLKKGGSFIACFFIKGKSKRTDWLVHRILSKKGWFTPPFPTEEQLLKILRRLYTEVDHQVDGSMVYFKCIK